ncbi:MAG: DUF6485 family protein [Eubacteriales bacterium]|jgi:hypothetical protein
MDCRLDLNKKKCPCSYEPCRRKGKCCECIEYHWKMRQLPGCLFPQEDEKTYDRSLERFIKIYSRKP